MEYMLALLREIDPESGEKLHVKDKKRVLRALEVYRETGKTISQHNKETKLVPDKYQPVWLGLDYVNRQDLYDRINLRVDMMLQKGLMEEIHRLKESGVPEVSTAMQAIGYKEFLPVLKGQATLEEAAEIVKQESRRYAKRQLTWFRRNPLVHWLMRTPEQDFSKIMEEALAYIPFFDSDI